MTSYDAKIEITLKRIRNVIADELEVRDTVLVLPNVIGELVGGLSHSRTDVTSNILEWSINCYVATKVLGVVPELLKLHSFLVKHQLSKADKFDFEHCDRYGMAFADGDVFKSMAFQTQSYTYMVLLIAKPLFEAEGIAPTPQWAVHIRQCTPSRYSQDCARPELKSLAFLASEEDVGIETTSQASPYFRYKDGRDQGFVCSVEPSLIAATPDAKDSIIGYTNLKHIMHDLMAHASCLPD